METVVDGLVRPHGIVATASHLFIVDPGARTVIAHDREADTSRVIAAHLPVGPPPGVVARPLRGVPPLSGPMGPFSGLARRTGGTMLISADGDGGVPALCPGEVH